MHGLTQNWATTSRVGLFTLNLLVTATPLEREANAERAHDKRLAARRKGMRTGGPTPWGYRLEAGKRIDDVAAAVQVRAVLALLLRTGRLTHTIEFAQP